MNSNFNVSVEDIENSNWQDIVALEYLHSHIKSFDFKARIADLLWIKRKDYLMAKEAAMLLVKAASLLFEKGWPPVVKRLEAD